MKKITPCLWFDDNAEEAVNFGDLMQDGGAGRSERVMNALLAMKKLDIAALQRAYDNGE